MCRLLHLLADPTNSRTALFLLREDGHHGLGEQVGVLTVTHHLLQERGGSSSAQINTRSQQSNRK